MWKLRIRESCSTSMTAKTTSVWLRNKICFALPDHGIRQAVYPAAAQRDHLTHDAQRNFLGCGRPQVESGRRVNTRDLFLRGAAGAQIIKHQPSPMVACNQAHIGSV